MKFISVLSIAIIMSFGASIFSFEGFITFIENLFNQKEVVYHNTSEKEIIDSLITIDLENKNQLASQNPNAEYKALLQDSKAQLSNKKFAKDIIERANSSLNSSAQIPDFEALGLITEKKYTTPTYSFIENVDTLVVVKGTIKNRNPKYKSFKISQSRPYDEDFVRTFKIKDDNSFERSITLKEDGFYILSYANKKYKVFITPGDTLKITFDAALNEEIVFGGKSGNANNYLRCKDLQNEAMQKYEQNLNAKDFENFKEKVEYFKTVRHENFEELLLANVEIPEKFINLERSNIDFTWARAHINYLKANPNKKLNQQYDFVKELDLSNSSNFRNYTYRKFAFDYFEYRSVQKLAKKYGKEGMYNYDYAKRYSWRYNDIDKLFKDEQIKDFLKTDLVYNAIKKTKNDKVNNLVLKFRRDVAYQPYLDRVNTQYKRNVKLGDGTFAPDFKVTDRNGKTKSLEDFRGKYLYIAVWASWCAPCKMEQPYLEDLKREFGRKSNLEIISISVDKSKSSWENAIVNGNITEPQYIAPGNWNSPFSKAYNIKALPRYILIDPQGQIVDLSTHKPSSSALRFTLEEEGLARL